MGVKPDGGPLLTFGDHLEELRRTLFRILGVVGVVSIVLFCLKDIVWPMLLAPSKWNFVTYCCLEDILHFLGIENANLGEFHVKLIATDLTSQFMTHITTSVYLGLLLSSPYVLYELFRFISPALYENERQHSVRALVSIYLLFAIGVFLTYFVIFPITFRFLGTYQVSPTVESTITLKSYISTFIRLSLLMGIVFQLPVIALTLSKLGLINAEKLSKYRKYAFVIVITLAAIITPGQDIVSLLLVSAPLYFLYEVSIKIIR